MTESSPDLIPDASRVVGALEQLVRGLTAYRQDVQLYPAGHPRVTNRLQELYDGFAEFMMERKKVFVLQVREGTLFSSNRQITDESPAVRRLASFLRERMIQLIQVSPGVTRGEIEEFIGILLRDPEDLLGETRLCAKIGPSLTVYYFPQLFGDDEPITEEEIIAGVQEEAALGGEVSVAFGGDQKFNASDWITFDRDQLHAIARVVQREPLRTHIERVRKCHGLDRGGRDFLPAFLEIFRRDPRTNWADADGLASLITAGLQLVETASTSKEGSSQVAPILQDMGDSEVGTHTRWRLLTTFFPGMYQQRSILEEESLTTETAGPAGREQTDFDWENKGGGWSLPDVAEGDWGSTDPESLRGELDRQFQDATLFGECSSMMDALTTLQPSFRADNYRRCLLGSLRSQLREGRVSVTELDTFLEGLEHLPLEAKRTWRVDLLCEIARPEDVLFDLSGGDSDLMAQLLSRPPAELETEIPSSASLAEPREGLRRILSRRDFFAMDVVLEASTLATAIGESALWNDVVREVCEGNTGFGSWARGRIDKLMEPDASEFLLTVFDASVASAMREHLRTVSDHRLLPIIRRYGVREDEGARKLLLLALEAGSPAVQAAAVAALGRQEDPECLDVLRELLIRQNKELTSVGAVESLCDALTQYDDGLAFLHRVRTERGPLGLHQWKKPLRIAAEEALEKAKQQWL